MFVTIEVSRPFQPRPFTTSFGRGRAYVWGFVAVYIMPGRFTDFVNNIMPRPEGE